MEESIRNYKLLSEEKKEQMMVGFTPEIIYFRVLKNEYCGKDKLPEPTRFGFFIILSDKLSCYKLRKDYIRFWLIW